MIRLFALAPFRVAPLVYALCLAVLNFCAVNSGYLVIRIFFFDPVLSFAFSSVNVFLF